MNVIDSWKSTNIQSLHHFAKIMSDAKIQKINTEAMSALLGKKLGHNISQSYHKCHYLDHVTSTQLTNMSASYYATYVTICEYLLRKQYCFDFLDNDNNL